jgi:hypothetical protein
MKLYENFSNRETIFYRNNHESTYLYSILHLQTECHGYEKSEGLFYHNFVWFCSLGWWAILLLLPPWEQNCFYVQFEFGNETSAMKFYKNFSNRRQYSTESITSLQTCTVLNRMPRQWKKVKEVFSIISFDFCLLCRWAISILLPPWILLLREKLLLCTIWIWKWDLRYEIL